LHLFKTKNDNEMSSSIHIRVDEFGRRCVRRRVHKTATGAAAAAAPAKPKVNRELANLAPEPGWTGIGYPSNRRPAAAAAVPVRIRIPKVVVDAQVEQRKKVFGPLREGTIIDVRDKLGAWWPARVIGRCIKFDIGPHIMVAFDGWSSKFNETISDTNRVAPLHTHTSVLTRRPINKHSFPDLAPAVVAASFAAAAAATAAAQSNPNSCIEAAASERNVLERRLAEIEQTLKTVVQQQVDWMMRVNETMELLTKTIHQLDERTDVLEFGNECTGVVQEDKAHRNELQSLTVSMIPLPSSFTTDPSLSIIPPPETDFFVTP
jgi:hypothetical protein